MEAKSEDIEDDYFRMTFIENYTINETEADLLKFFLFYVKRLYSESMILSSDTECTLSLVIPTIRSLIGYYKNELDVLMYTQDEYTYNEISITNDNRCFRSFYEFEEEVEEKDYNGYQWLLNEQKVNIYNTKKELLEKIIEGIEIKMINTNDLIMNEESIISTFINPKFKDLFLDDDQMAIVDNFFSKYDTNVTSSQSKYSVGIIRKKERDYNEVKKIYQRGCIG